MRTWLFAVPIVARQAMTGAGDAPRSSTAHAVESPPDYTLTVRVSPDDRRLEGTGTVRIAPADTARANVVLSLSERMGEPRIEDRKR